RDRDLRAGGVDLVDPASDELIPDRSCVGGGEDVVDLVVRRVGDLRQALRRLVVASLDAFEVQDREAAERGERTGEGRIDDRGHRRGGGRDGGGECAEAGG